jgi:hypothetical protein
MAIKRAVLGSVKLTVVENEDFSYNNTISDSPIESGANISDHVESDPITGMISGVIVGSDSKKNKETLIKYWKTGKLLKYVGRSIISNVVIENFSETNDKTIQNGFKFNISLKQIRVAKTQKTVLVKVKLKPIVTPKKNTGKKTTKKKTTNTAKKTTTRNGTVNVQDKLLKINGLNK